MKYGFIGCGNMGSALARALAKKTKDIMLADHSAPRAEALARELECRSGSNADIASGCSAIFLGVKPQVMSGMLSGISGLLKTEKPLLITMAAGVEIKKIEAAAGTRLPVIRIMPNTPVSVGKGMILYCKNDLVDDAALNGFLNDMSYAGMFDELDEQLIDAGCALSGCGPAYVYMFIEALADGAVACGLPRDKAVRYAAATLSGAAQLALDSGKHTGALKDAVCSPGGSTIAGVRVLEDSGFRGAVIDGVIAAFNRNKELGK